MKTLDELGISPAPWRNPTLGLIVNGNNKKVIDWVHAVYEPSDADACLIAAAPDCLMSLDEVLTALKNRLPSQPTLNELEIIDRAEAAIRKATGESEGSAK